MGRISDFIKVRKVIRSSKTFYHAASSRKMVDNFGNTYGLGGGLIHEEMFPM